MPDIIRLSGKGSKRRPQEVSQDTFADNWDRIFGKKENDGSRSVPQGVRGGSTGSVHAD